MPHEKTLPSEICAIQDTILHLQYDFLNPQTILETSQKLKTAHLSLRTQNLGPFSEDIVRETELEFSLLLDQTLKDVDAPEDARIAYIEAFLTLIDKPQIASEEARSSLKKLLGYSFTSKEEFMYLCAFISQKVKSEIIKKEFSSLLIQQYFQQPDSE